MTKERRIGLASIWHETLTFSDARTEFEDFLKFQVSESVQVAESNHGVKNEMGGFLDTVPQLKMKAVPLFFAGALPSATVSAAAYERLRTRFVSLLTEALPLDGLLIGLHGAMVAENAPDVEADPS